jgi:hypothetical protein
MQWRDHGVRRARALVRPQGVKFIALTQTQWNPKAKVYYQKKIAEGKTKKHALRCVMKRVACILYGMLKSGEAYRV